MAHDERHSAVGASGRCKSPNRIAHESVGRGECTACVGRFIPDIEPCRRSDVNIRSNSQDIFNDVTG